MKKIRVVVIGAGSMSLGRGTLADVMASDELHDLDCTLCLVDIDEEALDVMFEVAGALKAHYGSPVKIERTTDRREGLAGADYVIAALAQKRQELWEQDFRLPLSLGFRHILGENGGPGAAFHTLRSLELTIPICRDMEELCPDALFLNFTNPESRVCMGINELTGIRSVGLCHGMFMGEGVIAGALGRDKNELLLTIGGINHFHWFLEVKDAATGEDLYPELKEKLDAMEPPLPPLTRQLLDLHGLLPFPWDNHIGEYISYAYEFEGLKWEYGNEGKKVYLVEPEGEPWSPPREELKGYLRSGAPFPERMTRQSGEIAIPIICDVELDKGTREKAVNVPNDDFAVANLPEDAIVEVPAIVDAGGIHPVEVGPLPEAIAAMCRSQISIQKLLVAAYRERSRDLLLQALLLDPIVDSVSRARLLIDEMLVIEEDFLPDMTGG